MFSCCVKSAAARGGCQYVQYMADIKYQMQATSHQNNAQNVPEVNIVRARYEGFLTHLLLCFLYRCNFFQFKVGGVRN